MDDIGFALIGILIVLIMISAFFSGSETSIMAINQIKLDNAADKGKKSAKRINILRSKIDRVLGVILIGNNLVNISASALLTYFVIKNFGDEYVWIGTLILTILIIIFAEIAPKNYAARKPEAIAYPASSILEFLTMCFGWLANILSMISSKITGVSNNENYFTQNLNRDELKTVLEKDTEEVEKEEMDALKSLLELKELTVQDILIPINDVISIHLDSIGDFENIDRNKYYPVISGEGENYIGFIHSKEIEQLEEFQSSAQDFLIEPYYVPESTQLFSQLKNFQKKGTEVAIVVDEYGEVTGLVTLEDLIEQVVGRLNAEEEDHGITRNDDGSILADGNLNVRDLNKFMGWTLSEDGEKTLSGLVIDHLDQIPTANVCVNLDGYKIETTYLEENVIRQVRVSKIN